MDTRWRPSVTVAAVVERDGRFLLVEEETSEGLRLNNPAGHLEPGETPPQGCAREALEESGWHVEPTHLLGVYLARGRKPATGEDVTYLRFAYVAAARAHEPDRPLDQGIMRALWLTPGEVRAAAHRHRSPLVLRCMEDYLAGVRHPLDTVYCDPDVCGDGIGPSPASGLPPERE